MDKTNNNNSPKSNSPKSNFPINTGNPANDIVGNIVVGTLTGVEKTLNNAPKIFRGMCIVGGSFILGAFILGGLMTYGGMKMWDYYKKN